MLPLNEGFAAAASRDARVLVLGSLPGLRSIAAGEYYAHPRNAFWLIVEELFAIPRSAPYHVRIEKLNGAGIGLWDVLHASRRQGSLDAKIDAASAVANDLQGFLNDHPRIELLAFNGKVAAQLFDRHVSAGLLATQLRRITLPSTSPAHAAMTVDEKLRHWRQIKIS
ncbi:MAG: DNA-deoxyinosine glycosylase [Woeseia sp.]|nr:DNA-deoxyinosine glycosylase [Woeseia sp.]MBT8095944.1 DNA-deoxyinosine glycosylase [Woeseia sp.]NNE61089.1 DNA-deoxyinosine glycosylase [Woeseia sp.]NNL53770.1 DNA-deoxyinosine glycosylase [Woeseia sp.]